MNKMLKISLILLSSMTLNQLHAQGKFFSKTANIMFDADGSTKDIEEIKATSKTATCVVVAESGAMEWAVLMKSFKFKNALMQEHFNENYVESSKYPKAVFKGKIDDASAIKWSAEGSYPVSVSGKMTCHGVEKEIKTQGTIVVKKGVPSVVCNFDFPLADYKISVPSVVGAKIAEHVQIKVNAALAPLKK